VLVEAFYENVHWGPSSGTPESDPNPRLQALLAAARRGARVRVLLDGFLDSEGENAETVAYLRQVAQGEQLDLQARLGNPTSLGLHNKMVLVRIGSRGHVHAGSINGNETSSKLNRELALQVQSDAAYSYLQAVFDYDWSTAAPPVYLPLVIRQYVTPPAAQHALISEAYYATVPEKEWVEIYNPTEQAVDLSLFKLGDAAHPEDYEGMVQFPPGTTLGPRQKLVVAATASGFRQDFPGDSPDLEMLDTDPAVPDMLRYANWGAGDWGLNNAGDEVLLLNSNDAAVDVLVYGAGSYPGVTPHPGGIAYNHSLQRYPPWIDTDDCSADFRDWAYPNPGEAPLSRCRAREADERGGPAA
jgi:hypothetical protein